MHHTYGQPNDKDHDEQSNCSDCFIADEPFGIFRTNRQHQSWNTSL